MVRSSPVIPSMWSAWKWVKKTSVNENPTPYRIICRWLPSPQSKRIVSPSRCSASPATLRSTVGHAAPVPRNVTVSISLEDLHRHRNLPRVLLQLVEHLLHRLRQL